MEMEKILTEIATSVSEFRSDIPGALKRAGDAPFAVLNNNKPSFYVLSPAAYDEILERLFDLKLAPVVESRLANAADRSISVELEDL